VPKASPNEIVIPLRPNIGSGPYAVRWAQVDVEDGHLIAGAYVFSVGAAFTPSLSRTQTQGGSGASASAIAARGLLLAGILVAAGVVLFVLLVARSASRAEALVVGAALGVATVGAILDVVVEAGETSTRFGRWTIAGACIAAVGAVAALVPRARVVAAAAAILLLGLPTATGHASTDPPLALSIPADLLHMAAAAFWIGGLVELVALRRAGLARRFSPWAVSAVGLLGVSGVLRALKELASVHQLWTTSYGRALLVKTGILAGLLVLGWLNRRRFASGRGRAELVLLAVVVGAVAVLTNVRPGRAYAVVAAPTGSQAVVYAGENDTLAIGLTAAPHAGDGVELRATVLGFDGPVRGLHIRLGVDGRTASASPCGNGCYAATVARSRKPKSFSVFVAGKTLRFAAPSAWPAPSALDIVRRAEHVISGLHSLVVHSHLASDARHAVDTTYTMVAPDRLAYRNDDGSGSVIIGTKRWDRAAGGKWVESPQLPALPQPAPFWSPDVTDAHILRTDRVGDRDAWVVSFSNPSTPAWFTAWIDRSTYRTVRLEMVAAAHFMRDRDGPFNAPVDVQPPGA
jgi:copper transport protein